MCSFFVCNYDKIYQNNFSIIASIIQLNFFDFGNGSSSVDGIHFITRMHSSRMRTIYNSSHLWGGGLS